ncbi:MULTISPECIES: ATP-binding protein [Caproicibacterium]|uniref:ATP-binding protein n=1 Tax=Caproicibacterium argilliputei TaxID=3030016 RepID=A0AA97H3W4_9FIRM|nr:ATP-binding protein [Caproicibacterium argilliputei]WOC32748.1 ATP-binding protein [Caproicibacterium argilliputei]
MNQMRQAAEEMASLSIYRGILQRTVPKALYRLLWAKDRETFLRAWGDFFAALCERECSESFAEHLTGTALYDENGFSLAAAAGETNFAPSMMQAVQRDLQIILKLARMTPDDLLDNCGYENLPELPRWNCGKPISILEGAPNAYLARMTAYYRKNGCGMYARYRAFIWREKKILPVAHPDPQKMADLKGYDVQRGLVENNTVAFLHDLPANNCLLYGDRGTGKSSTVKALLNEYDAQGLRVIEMPKEYLMDFPYLVDQIASIPMHFIIFIDDLSFSQQDGTYAALKSVLQGGLAAKPANALIYATSNRRHLLRESFSDREGDDVHRNDTVQESLSLSDRFGLAVNFMNPDKAHFLDIIAQLAHQRQLDAYLPQLEIGAERWATVHGGRSPRVAQQYIRDAQAKVRLGQSLDEV